MIYISQALQKKSRHKLVFLFFFVFSAFLSHAQIDFEQGYLIDNKGDILNGYIKNYGWYQNPDQFEFKRALDGVLEIWTIEDAQEVAVPGVFKFVRSTVGVDRVGDRLTDLTESRNPALHEETLFLKVLVEGEATLYLYRDSGIERYFYSVAGGEAESLIYRRFKRGNKVAQNNYFRQQLLNDMACADFRDNRFIELKYNKSDLTSFFEDYNSCIGSAIEVFNAVKKDQDLFDLKIKIGAGHRGLEMGPSGMNSAKNLEAGLEYKLGVELEYTLPVLRNKWSLFFDPTFYMFKTKGRATVGGFYPPPSNPGAGTYATVNLSVDYPAVSLPFGIRHHMFLSEESEIFLNAGIAHDFIFENVEIRNVPEKEVDLPDLFNQFIGAGYVFNGKYSAELRYTMGSMESEGWSVKSNSISLMIGYKIF